MLKKVYFIYKNEIVCGAITDKKSDGFIVAIGNELWWLLITEPRFETLNDALAYKNGAFLTWQVND